MISIRQKATVLASTMPLSDNDGEADAEELTLTEMIAKKREENAKLEAFMASHEYQLACHAAVQANKLEIALEDDKSGGTSE